MVDSVNPRVAELVVGKPSVEANSSAPLFTPALSHILESYATNGAGDRTLLLAILKAKAEEDKRLAALDNFRAEQLRAANTLSSYNASLQYPPYWAPGYQRPIYSPSPTSPPSATTPLPVYSHYPSYPSSQPPSNPARISPVQHLNTREIPPSPPIPAAQPTSTSNTSPSSSKRKRSETPKAAAAKISGKTSVSSAVPKKKAKASHEEVMLALRLRCERNKAKSDPVTTVSLPHTSTTEPQSRSSPPIPSSRSTSPSQLSPPILTANPIRRPAPLSVSIPNITSTVGPSENLSPPIPSPTTLNPSGHLSPPVRLSHARSRFPTLATTSSLRSTVEDSPLPSSASNDATEIEGDRRGLVSASLRMLLDSGSNMGPDSSARSGVRVSDVRSSS